MMNLWWRNNFLLITFIIGTLVSTTASAKKIKLEWKAIQGAVSYEIQFQKPDGTVVQKISKKSEFRGDLEYGAYLYRVRAVDKFNQPGVWSKRLNLAVMPSSPEPLTPENGSKVVLYDSEKAVTVFRWNPIQGAQSYQLVINKGASIVLNGLVQGTHYDYKGLLPGRYTWVVKAVLQSQDREPSSQLQKRWATPTSAVETFAVVDSKLTAPVLIYPVGIVPASSNDKMTFRWKRVNGAQSYVVTVKPIKLEGRQLAAYETRGKFYVTDDDTLTVPVSSEGSYSWEVKPQANVSSNNIATATGPASAAEFQVSKDPLFVAGEGYLAFSTMLAPYTYSVDSQSTGSQGSTKSNSITYRLSGEYWLSPQWGVAVGFDDTQFEIQSQSFSRTSFELDGKYRIALSGDRLGWFIIPKAGFEMRQYVEVLPDNPADVANGVLDGTTITALGASVGFDIRKQFSESFSLGLKASYFYPLALTGAPGSQGISGSASKTNLSAGLQGLYWLSPHWGLGLGVFSELRGISYDRISSTGTGVDTVKMNGNYFFGSVVFSFGR